MQGLKFLPAVLALVLAATSLPATHAGAAAAKKPAAAASAKKRVALHQFTGVVTALDKTSLTVEKSGKAAKTIVFEKHAEMNTTGDLEKNARVTVYYRDEGGRPVAHKVVVKSATETASR